MNGKQSDVTEVSGQQVPLDPAHASSATRPRVVHLTTVDMSLALLLLPQLVAFQDAGFEVIGVSAPGPYVSLLEANGIRHAPLDRSTRSTDLWADLRTARDFRRLCRELRPDIVHTHNPKPGIYGRIAARLTGVPVVVNTVHGLYAQPQDPLIKRSVVYGLERLASTCSQAELVQNPEDLAVLRRLRFPPHKLHLLGNGVDLSRFDRDAHAAHRSAIRRELAIGNDAVIVGLVGRLVAEKGYREVFAAAAALRRETPHIRFVVIGPEDHGKKDAIQAHELDAARHNLGITFLGERSDVERLYPAMDLYVLASHREGFPRAAMEAAAMGLPVVATDIRGCRQVVDEGVTGLIVPVGSPKRLAKAIASLAVDHERRREMGEKSRIKALREFDDRRQVEITLSVYRRLLADRPRSTKPASVGLFDQTEGPTGSAPQDGLTSTSRLLKRASVTRNHRPMHDHAVRSATASNETGSAMTELVRVASVIVTYKRRDVLRQTLGAVLGQTRPPDEVIVVDNDSEDGTLEMLEEEFPRVRCVEMGENLGFAAGLQAGMRVALEEGASFTWLMDDDSMPFDEALSRLLTVATAVERCGVVGLSGGGIKFGVPDRTQPLERVDTPVGSTAFRAGFVLVDGALVRADAARDAGFPRADFFMMMEDIEYTGRVRRAGWDVLLLDDDLISRGHLGSGGSAPGGSAPPWRGYYQSRNHLAVALEHRSAVEVGAWLVRQFKYMVAAAMKSDQKWRRITYRLRGGVDAFRGRMGRTIEPDGTP